MSKRDGQLGSFARCSLVLLLSCVLLGLAGLVRPFSLGGVWRGDLWAFSDNGWMLSFTYYENWPYRGTADVNLIRLSDVGTIKLPTILLIALLAVVSLSPVIRWWECKARSRAAARKGLCQNCGYDVRASADRCPECGTPIPADVVRPPIDADPPM